MLMEWLVWAKVHSIIVVTAVFTILLVTTYWPGRRETLERHGQIPLQDDL